MSEHWYTKLKDSFIKLADFIEENKTSVPHDSIITEYLNAVVLFKRADLSDIKKAVRELVCGKTIYNGVEYTNIDLMKGLNTGVTGFVTYDPETKKNGSGTFVKSYFKLSFVSKRSNADNVVIPICSEIVIRKVLDKLRDNCSSNAKLTTDFIAAWYYSMSCLADSLCNFIDHYCLDVVSVQDRKTIRDLVPKECFTMVPLGNSIKMENIFKLVKNISKSEMTRTLMKAVNITPESVDHLIINTEESIENLNIDDIRNKTIAAVETGEIPDMTNTFGGLLTTVSGWLPAADEGDPEEQD